MGDLIIIAVLAVSVVLALRSMAKDRRRGSGCGYGCSGCTRNCAHRAAHIRMQKGEMR